MNHSQHDPIEKSPMSFFRRPIRMRRGKKSPPAPLIVAPSTGIHSSSSHSGARFNSLLTAAARSIRTGDSRLFESFQAAALSPKPLQSQLPPSAQKHLNFHSLKRIPVPSYSPHRIRPPAPKPDFLARSTSLERPRTATKHSRTTSLPYSQAPPTLEPPPLLKTHSHQDLAESLEKLSAPERTLSQLFHRPPNSSPVHAHSTPHLQLDQSKSNLSYPSSPLDSGLFSLDFSTHSHKPNPLTPTSARRTSFNPSFEQSRDIVSKALASPSTPCLPQLGSQVSLPVPPSAHPSSHRSSLYSSTSSARGLSARPNDLLEPKKNSFNAAREAQRRSFQNMPLPALPLPISPKPQQPPSSAFLELPPIPSLRKGPQTNGFQTPKKQQRPWSIASPGSYNDPHESENSLSENKPSFDRTNPPTTADQVIFTGTSPLKVSTLARQNHRHSYPSQSIPNLSPLERVSDHLQSVYSANQTDNPLLKLPTSDAGSIGQRENDALRLSPSITTPCGNLMFGFRGEVFELDKYPKPSLLDPSVKALTDSDPHITSPQPTPPNPKLSPVLIDPKTSNSVERKDGGLNRSLPPSSNSSDARPVVPPKPHAIHQPEVVPDSSIKTQRETGELGEFIELKDICLIGSDLLDFAQEHFKTSNQAEEPIVAESSSPRNSERNCSTEIALESLSIDRGSSEEESSRVLEESIKFDSGPEPKIINPETSLEMAAIILGQPVPPISKEIRQGFERIHNLFSDGRSQDSVRKDYKQELMTKILKSLDHKIGESLTTSDAAIQTDPVEFMTPRTNPSIFQPSPMMIPRINSRRIAGSLKNLASRNELSEHNSKENLPLNLTRHSIQSEKSFVSAGRSYGVANNKEDQQESLRTSGGMLRSSPRSDYTTELPSFRKQGLSEMSDSNRRFSSTWTYSHQYGQNSPLRNNTRESHLGLQMNTNTLNETVLDALDKALRAEEGFQREKQHLQSVARRQSQTIESLLIDKEVLSLEVSRLTGLVELLARDHNLLNDRIDQAEQALDKFPPSASSNRVSGHVSQNPDETINYFTASGEIMTILKEEKAGSDAWIKQGTRKRRKGADLSETDDGIMAGDSEDWEDGYEDDGESLCDPEQSSFLNDPLTLDFSVQSDKIHLEPIPGSYSRPAPPHPNSLSFTKLT